MKFLRSKTTIPHAPDYLIERPRLLDIFNQNNHSSAYIFTAPAGYGKTSLTIQYFNQLPAKMKCWISLEPHDSDPRLFSGYLLEALSRPIPRIRQSGLFEYLITNPFDINEFINDLCFFLEAYQGPLIWLVLDNFEVINKSRDICAAIYKLINYSQIRLRLIINSREKPNIQVHKLHEVGRIVLLSQSDLKFTRDELGQAIEARTRHKLNEDEVEEVYEMTRGWCVSVGFINEIMHHTNVTAGLALIRGIKNTGSISGYLDEEISSKIVPDLQKFLAYCSPLDIISRDSCSIFIQDESEIKQKLQALENSSIPIVTVAKNEYRLHPLIRQTYNEYLKENIPADELIEHYKKISNYYLQLEDPIRAIDLLFDIGSYQEALELLNSQWQNLMSTNNNPALSNWLTQIPVEYQDNPLYINLESNFNTLLGNFKEAMDRMKYRLETSQLPKGHPVLGTLWYYYNHCHSCVDPGPHYQNMLASWDKFNTEFGPFGEPVLVGTHDMLGYTAYYELKFEKSIEHIELAIKLNPPANKVNYYKYMVLRELLRHESGDTKSAQTNLLNMIKSMESNPAVPLPPLPLIFYIRILTSTGQFDSALNYISKCHKTIQFNPLFNDVINVHLNRYKGFCRIYNGSIEDGLETLKQSVEWARKSFLNEYNLSALIYEFYCASHDRDVQVLDKNEYPVGDFESESLLYYYMLQEYRLLKASDYNGAMEVIRKLNNVAETGSIYHWQATGKFYESYLHYQLGQMEIADRLLIEGSEILENICWDIYPAAAPTITAYVITRLITINSHVELARRLSTTVNNKAIISAILAANGTNLFAPEHKQNILAYATAEKLPGLLEIAAEWSAQQNSTLSDSAAGYIAQMKALPPPALDIITLGGFMASIDGISISFTRQKSKELFLWMILEHPRSIHEEVIMEYFWPETDPRKSKSNLQTTISSLRKSLDTYLELNSQAYIEYNSGLYSINIPVNSQIDFRAFADFSHEYLNNMSSNPENQDAIDIKIKTALDSYKGELLPELYYEDFTAAKREELRNLYFSVLEKYIAALIANNKFETAEYYIKSGLRIDPLWSTGVKYIMTVYLRTDKIVSAMKAYRKFEDQLTEELNIQPQQELKDLFSQLQSY